MAVLDAAGVERAHVVGMSMGGVLVQLLALDHPDRLLNGDAIPFDADAFRAMETACIEHSGTHRNPATHARASQDGLERGAELAGVQVPFLVVEAPQDPINPPPHPAYLAGLVPGARLVTVDGMGHALAPSVLAPLTQAVLAHTTGGRAGSAAD